MYFAVNHRILKNGTNNSRTSHFFPNVFFFNGEVIYAQYVALTTNLDKLQR